METIPLILLMEELQGRFRREPGSVNSSNKINYSNKSLISKIKLPILSRESYELQHIDYFKK